MDPGEAHVIKLNRPLPAAPVPQPLPFTPLGYADEAARPDAVPTIQQPDPAIYAADRFYPANAVQADREQPAGELRSLRRRGPAGLDRLSPPEPVDFSRRRAGSPRWPLP